MNPFSLRYSRRDINQLCSDVEYILQNYDANTIDYSIFCNGFKNCVGKDFEDELNRVDLDCTTLLSELFHNLPLRYYLKREAGRLVIERVQHPGLSLMMGNYIVRPTTPQQRLCFPVPQPFPQFNSAPTHVMQWMGPRSFNHPPQQRFCQGIPTRPSEFASLTVVIDIINGELLKKKNITIEELFESIERNISTTGQRLNTVIEKDFVGFVRRYIMRGDIRAVEQDGCLIYKPQVLQIEENAMFEKYSSGAINRDGCGEVTLPDSPSPPKEYLSPIVTLKDMDNRSSSKDADALILPLKEVGISSLDQEINLASSEHIEGLKMREQINSVGKPEIVPSYGFHTSDLSPKEGQSFVSMKSPLDIAPTSLQEKSEIKSNAKKFLPRETNFANMPHESSSKDLNNACEEVESTNIVNKYLVKLDHVENDLKLIHAKRTCLKEWGDIVNELPDLLWILQLMYLSYGPVLIKEFDKMLHRIQLLLDPKCKCTYEFDWERYNIDKVRMYELKIMVTCPEDKRKTLPADCIINTKFLTLQVGIPSQLFTYLKSLPTKSDSINHVVNNLEVLEKDASGWKEMNEMEKFLHIVQSADNNNKVFEIREGTISLRSDDTFFIITHIEGYKTDL